jgi:hypothetical protein
VLIAVAADGRISLAEPDDFRRFSIRLAEGEPARRAMAAALRPDGEDHAWVPADLVRRLAGGDAAWEEGFAKMLAFATGRGWVDGDGAIRAHIEREAS